jgi:hypothetical protein
VADDVRFPNEVALIRSLGGIHWRIERPGVVQGAHSSEQLAGTPDLTLVNDRSIEGLQTTVVALARKWAVAA